MEQKGTSKLHRLVRHRLGSKPQGKERDRESTGRKRDIMGMVEGLLENSFVAMNDNVYLKLNIIIIKRRQSKLHILAPQPHCARFAYPCNARN